MVCVSHARQAANAFAKEANLSISWPGCGVMVFWQLGEALADITLMLHRFCPRLQARSVHCRCAEGPFETYGHFFCSHAGQLQRRARHSHGCLRSVSRARRRRSAASASLRRPSQAPPWPDRCIRWVLPTSITCGLHAPHHNPSYPTHRPLLTAALACQQT